MWWIACATVRETHFSKTLKRKSVDLKLRLHKKIELKVHILTKPKIRTVAKTKIARV